MELKWTVIVLLLTALLLVVNADKAKQRQRYKKGSQPKRLQYKCVPGRTIIRIDKKPTKFEVDSESNEYYRRSERWSRLDESCNMCICSADGQYEYCMKRPAIGINECILMSRIKNQPEAEPYALERNLVYRIRRVGGDAMPSSASDTKKCIPFVSQYTDCTEENLCSGCTRCACSDAGLWVCSTIQQCNNEPVDAIDDEMFDAAIEKLDYELKNQKEKESARQTPAPKDASDELLEIMNKFNTDEALRKIINRRSKRSPGKSKSDRKSGEKTNKKAYNGTVKFYSTIDELNEDTLKNTNVSGTLHARRVALNDITDISRRSNTKGNYNKSLHIDFNYPKEFNHITDNKIDSIDHLNKIDIEHEKLNNLINNQTQKMKDKDLSKLVVNELKPGQEVVGDTTAPVTSNITFTSENDTLTAMAFIAGNLLNKLWSMEKEASGTSFETEDMKQEKITELLELFKEPLNLRQEAFLKSALEKISSAIDKNKDIKNITICETIAEAQQIIDIKDKNDEETPSPEVVVKHTTTPCQHKNIEAKPIPSPAFRAVSKVNNVLNLLKKLENIQRNITNLKNSSEQPTEVKDGVLNNTRKQVPVDAKPKENSLNMFGNLINKITNLLLPKKQQKKIDPVVKHMSTLNNDNYFRDKVLKMFDLDLTNMSVSAKDKIILDYLTHMQNNPKCVLNKNRYSPDTKYLPNVEGNILLNLSEFFKLKSFADLVNMLKPTKEPVKPILRNPNIEDNNNPVTSKTTEIVKNNKKIASTKDRLKFHLKNIIEDLLELQNAKGIRPDGHIKIVDALPCIYNIMNSNTDIFKKRNEPDVDKNVVDVLMNLKKDMEIAKTRRFDNIMQVRPKSAVVLERTLKTLGKKALNRRFLKTKMSPKIEEVQKIIVEIGNDSVAYKKEALFNDVPANERLTLLRILESNVKTYITILEDIKRILEKKSKMTDEQFAEIAKFISNSATNISLNEQLKHKLEKPPLTKMRSNYEMDTMNQILNSAFVKTPLTKFTSEYDGDSDIKISRLQIINQLIRNRIQSYIKSKEQQQNNLSGDMNYDIAKRVLINLDNGNYELAQELFKLLMTHKDKTKLDVHNHFKKIQETPPTILEPIDQNMISQLQPLIQFEEPKNNANQAKWFGPDNFIKQLLNIKHMRI